MHTGQSSGGTSPHVDKAADRAHPHLGVLEEVLPLAQILLQQGADHGGHFLSPHAHPLAATGPLPPGRLPGKRDSPGPSPPGKGQAAELRKRPALEAPNRQSTPPAPGNGPLLRDDTVSRTPGPNWKKLPPTPRGSGGRSSSAWAGSPLMVGASPSWGINRLLAALQMGHCQVSGRLEKAAFSWGLVKDVATHRTYKFHRTAPLSDSVDIRFHEAGRTRGCVSPAGGHSPRKSASLSWVRVRGFPGVQRRQREAARVFPPGICLGGTSCCVLA